MPNCWAMLILPSAWAPVLNNALAAREAANRVSAERLNGVAMTTSQHGSGVLKGLTLSL